MAKITTMDANATKIIRAALDEALPKIAESLGCSAQALKALYDPHGGTVEFKVRFALQTLGGIPRDQAEWNAYCGLIGFKPEHFGKAFRGKGGEMFKICGIDLKRRTFPILGENGKGKRLAFKDEAVLRQIEPAAAAGLREVPAPERTAQEGN